MRNKQFELFFSKCIEPYENIKSKHPDTILFFRKDDYYEVIFNDAYVTSKLIEIPFAEMSIFDTLKVPICIVPICNSDSSINRIVKTGRKVVICEKV